MGLVTFFIEKVQGPPSYGGKKAVSLELFKGAPRPSSLFVNMVCAELLRSVDKIKDFNSRNRNWRYKSIYLSWTITVDPPVKIHSFTFKVNDKDFLPSRDESAALQNAMLKAHELRKEFDKNREESERQQAAVSFIDEIFKTPPKDLPKPAVEEKEDESNDPDETLRPVKAD